MEKSADAFRTISEVADDLDVPKHVLRFWESKFSQIKPMKRGGGRRYYRPEDIELLRGIRRLLHEDGFTIRGVQKQIKDIGLESIKALGKAERPAGRKRAAPQVEPLTAGQIRMLTGLFEELEACRKLVAGLV